MVAFWNRLQIPGILLSQGNQPPKLLDRTSFNVCKFISSSDPRNFWSWKRGDKSKTKCDGQPTVCGKPTLKKVQPTNPNCASKCLQISRCKDKEMAMKRLSNCQEPEKITENPTSYWESLFGWTSKSKTLPDPRSCRNANYERQRLRQEDPRLCDSRYEATAGDVLIFTESPRPKICKSQEPRPKQPPSYKVPKAVLTQTFVKEAAASTHRCTAALQFEASCNDDSSKCSGPKASILPFEELRPPDKQRKIFCCKNGVRPEDVVKPLRRVVDCGGASIANERHRQRTVTPSVDVKLSEHDATELSLHLNSARDKSRIEQLKKLTRAKDDSRCC